MWLSAVFGEIFELAAPPPSPCDPPAISRSTSISRGVRPSSRAGSGAARRLAGGGEHRLGGVGAEPPSRTSAAQRAAAAASLDRRPVRPVLARGLVGLGGGQNPRRRRQVGRLGVAMVAAAVEALVMAEHQRRDRLCLRARAPRAPARRGRGAAARRRVSRAREAAPPSSRSTPAPRVRRFVNVALPSGSRGCRPRAAHARARGARRARRPRVNGRR